MVDDHPLPERRLGLVHTRAALSNDAAWLMAGDELRLAELVRAQVAAAHARSANRNDDFARSWPRVRKVAELDPLVAEEHEALHAASAYQRRTLF